MRLNEAQSERPSCRLVSSRLQRRRTGGDRLASNDRISRHASSRSGTTSVPRRPRVNGRRVGSATRSFRYVPAIGDRGHSATRVGSFACAVQPTRSASEGPSCRSEDVDVQQPLRPWAHWMFVGAVQRHESTSEGPTCCQRVDRCSSAPFSRSGDRLQRQRSATRAPMFVSSVHRLAGGCPATAYNATSPIVQLASVAPSAWMFADGVSSMTRGSFHCAVQRHDGGGSVTACRLRLRRGSSTAFSHQRADVNGLCVAARRPTSNDSVQRHDDGCSSAPFSHRRPDLQRPYGVDRREDVHRQRSGISEPMFSDSPRHSASRCSGTSTWMFRQGGCRHDVGCSSTVCSQPYPLG